MFGGTGAFAAICPLLASQGILGFSGDATIAAQCAAFAGAGKETFGGAGGIASHFISLAGEGIIGENGGAEEVTRYGRTYRLGARR